MTDVAYKIYIDWDNDGSVAAGAPTAGEDVSNEVLGLRTPVGWSLGRDTARSLGQIEPGEATMELNNRDRIFSPDNSLSPLFGNLGPGKPVMISSSHLGVTRNLFWGYIDDYKIDPFREKKSVTISAIDAVAKFADALITTEVYQGITTGQAIGLLLDSIGWPTALRDIDNGATTIRYFWVDEGGFLDNLKSLLASEGGPALANVDPATGNFVFRDRHHRFIDSASITSQATFTGSESEPSYCEPVEYDIGFRDLVNSVSFEVNERMPDVEAVIWNTEDVITVASGEVITLQAKADEPFILAQTPTVDVDYTLVSGDVTVSIDRTSGQSVNVTIVAATTSYIQNMAVRATPIPVARTYTITAKSQVSIDKYGEQSWSDQDPEWSGRHDAQAIANVIVAQRSERLPIFTFTVNNGNDVRKTQQLTRKLSDRITIVEPETGTNHDHYIEQIEHDISDVGKDHRVQYGCERVRTQSGTLLTFDVAGAGFDQGSFGISTFDDASTIFILGSAVSGHRLGTGKLGT